MKSAYKELAHLITALRNVRPRKEKAKLKFYSNNYSLVIDNWPTSVAVPSEVQVRSRWFAGIAGSNPAEGMDVRLLCLFVVCCVGSGLWDWLITRSEEFFRVCVFLCLCVV
jgi:hypothetical protein